MTILYCEFCNHRVIVPMSLAALCEMDNDAFECPIHGDHMKIDSLAAADTLQLVAATAGITDIMWPFSSWWRKLKRRFGK